MNVAAGPLVSVYIPTHNRAELVRRAIESVLNQSYSNIEVLVVNDGSRDETQTVLDSLCLQYPRVKIFQHTQPRGACAARNLAIEKACGKFITGLDDDDEFLPNRIESFLEAYDGNYAFLCSYKVLATERGFSNELIDKREISFEDMKIRNWVGNQVFIERDKLDHRHRFDPGMPAWQDYDLWFRLVKDYGRALKIPQHTYRMDLNTADNRISESSNAFKGYKMFVEKHQPDLTEAQQHNLLVNDLYNRRTKLSVLSTLKLARNWYALKKGFALYFLTHFPVIYEKFVTAFAKRRVSTIKSL